MPPRAGRIYRARFGANVTAIATNVNKSETLINAACLKEAADARDDRPCLSTGDEAGDDVRRWTPHYLSRVRSSTFTAQCVTAAGVRRRRGCIRRSAMCLDGLRFRRP